MRRNVGLCIAAVAASVLLAGCGSKADTPPAAAPKAPAKVEHRVTESELTRITLTPQAEQRLGIEVVEAAEGQTSGAVTLAGEVMLIPGKAIVLSAPAAGTLQAVRPSLVVGQTVSKGEPIFRLTPLIGPQRDLKVTYEADVRTAKARLDNASLQLERARQLLRDLAGSQRNVDTAEQEFSQAKAAHDAAVQRLEWLRAHPYEGDVDMVIPAPETGVVRQIQVSNGQTVAGGAPLLEVADLSRMWLRVPVYAGDSDAIGLPSRVQIRDIDSKGKLREGVRVAAPPTADAVALTTDLYYEISNAQRDLSPGQRLAVLLPSRASGRKAITVPASSLVYDIQGSAWVYVVDGAHVYRRQRVELLQTENKLAYLGRGITAGAKVVTTGVAELFGTEFGAGK